MHKLKINNSLDVARWEKLSCQCNHDSIESEYPIFKCEHCRCKEAWESVPQENYDIVDFDDKGIQKGIKTISEITLIRGHDLEDVIAWVTN